MLVHVSLSGYSSSQTVGGTQTADRNFTTAMTYKRVMQQSEHKYGHQMKALLDAGTHATNILMDGHHQAFVPKDEAYFAHLRFGWPLS